jgi:hypothetical protein
VNPAIVYLAQNTKHDGQHKRSSRQLLELSLDYLYAYYNNQFKQDVVIFHEGDFSPLEQQEVRKNRKEIRFEEIHFSMPQRPWNVRVVEKWREIGMSHYHWTMGHRHMCHFYGIRLWDEMERMGYDWCMRFDDDSRLLSHVNYDLFRHMAQHQYEYGYRVDCWEPPSLCLSFAETVDRYVREHNPPAPLYRQLRNPKPGYYPGYYNNWFITRVGFWRSPPVQHFLQMIHNAGNVYLLRWNDLVIQAAGVQLFCRPEQVHKYTDWSYEHASINRDGTLGWGGVFLGTKDGANPYAANFRERHGSLVASELTY